MGVMVTKGINREPTVVASTAAPPEPFPTSRKGPVPETFRYKQAGLFKEESIPSEWFPGCGQLIQTAPTPQAPGAPAHVGAQSALVLGSQ